MILFTLTTGTDGFDFYQLFLVYYFQQFIFNFFSEHRITVDLETAQRIDRRFFTQ